MTNHQSTTLRCSVCGGQEFISNPVLWDALAAAWELSPDERAYIDRQQGKACTACGANLRSIALSDAILSAVGATGTLQDYAASSAPVGVALLEINEAGTLTPILSKFPAYTLATYPPVDMQRMPYRNDLFDLVVHSDTVEHVVDPVLALSECYRVLRPGGRLCFTAPTVVGRMTRNRACLPKSYHGWPATGTDDYLVHSEFGADLWTFVIRAGFKDLTIHTVSFPDATAISARK